MFYREDEDLKFLGEMSSIDLNDLVDCVTKDKDGSARLTEMLTVSEIYKKYNPDHSKYWELIAAEVQCFGANSLATMFRLGKGVPYREVLCDVCDKAGVKYKKDAKIIEIEDELFIKLIYSLLENMSDSERIGFAKTFGYSNLEKLELISAIQLDFRTGGLKSYQLTLTLANEVSHKILGRGLALAANAALARTASVITGPIGWTLAGAWTIMDIAGPASKVTLPAVIQVALLRRKHDTEINEIKNKSKTEFW